jgi:peptide/nickel transport system permease protein
MVVPLAEGPALAGDEVPVAARGPRAVRFLVSMARREPLVVVACLILAATVVSALLASRLAPYAPDAVDPLHRLEGLGAPGHLLGTDGLGRDILSRLIWGAQISLVAGILPAVAAVALGTVIGILAGYAGRLVDGVIMRIVDVLLAFPFLLLAVALVASLGPSLVNAMIAVVVATVPGIVRLIRGQVLSLKELPFVDAARLLGYSHARIMFSEMLPSLVALVVTVLTIQIPVMILATTGLSFLGLGVQPPTADWGSMVNDGLADMTVAPHVVLVPSFTISLVALCFGVIGDTVQRRLNPRGGRP